MVSTPLTYGRIKSRLQVANCCAGVKGANIILKERKGFKCADQWHELDVQLALIDSIRCYAKTEYQLYASHTFDLTGHPTFNQIEIKTTSGTLITVGCSWQGTLAKTLALLISEAGFGGYTTTTDGNKIYFNTPVAIGSAGNAVAWKLTITTGSTSVVTIGNFSGGVDGNTIASTSAICYYSTVGWGTGSATFDLTLTTNFPIGGLTSFTSTGQSSNTAAINNIVTQINVANSGIAIASYDSTLLLFSLVSPTKGASTNSNTITWSETGGGAPVISPASHNFYGGVDALDKTFDDTNTCLTTLQVTNILDKLSTMCPEPCTTYVNFSS